jgi:hypothetical protein
MDQNRYAPDGDPRKIAGWMMQHIVLISCVSRKGPSREKCQDLYLSDLFRKNLRYARSLSPDKVFVLSAKYGLVGLDQEIEPYNETLNDKSVALVKEWAAAVREQIAQVADLGNDRFTFLAGIRYRRFLAPFMRHHRVPMIGLSIGRQLRFLKENVT